ncbi:MAG: hypothetical protein ACRDHG_04000 [Anaerolineales bacterium]
MMERRPSVSLESLLYLILLVIGAWLRFDQLDRHPLSDAEAREALSALPRPSAFRPPDLISGSPAYQVLTGLAFSFSRADDATARWASAVAGTALLMTPLLARRQIGRVPALMTTLLLALSPTLWAASRLAGGSAIAAVSLLAAVLFLVRARAETRGNLEWAAGMLGLAAVAGQSGIVGLTTVGVGSGVLLFLRRRRSNPHPDPAPAFPWPATVQSEALLRGLLVAGLVGLGLASGFGFFASALGGVFSGIGAWVEAWFSSGGVPAPSVLLQLPVYEPLVLVFGLAGLVRAVRKGTALDRWLAAWTAGAVLLILLYPGRGPEDILWAVIPLCFLAAGEASAIFDQVLHARPAWLLIGFVGAVVALLAFSFVQLAAFVRGPDAFQSFLGMPLLLMLAVMGIGLAAAAVVLLGLGWSRAIAITVAGAAGLLVLTALSISAGGRLNLAQASARELWRPQASTLGLRDLVETIDSLSRATVGRSAALPLQLEDQVTPGLAWVLRDYPAGDGSELAGNPAVVLRREGSAAGSLPSEYLGQLVSIGEIWGWTGWGPPDLFQWWVTREAPTLPDRWVLLVRPDIAGVEQPAPIGEP